MTDKSGINEVVTLRVPQLESTLKLFVHGDEDRFVSEQLRQKGIWEPYETALVLEFLEEGAVFVDVGANIGYFSIVAASRVGSRGKVLAFEPDPGNFALLKASCQLNGLKVQAVEAGLSTSDSSARLYLSEDNMGDHQIFQGEGERDSVAITLLNGADFLGQQLDRLDLLKVDTQGSEFAVMEGLLPWLRALPVIPRIVIELTPYSLREAGASGRRLVELLAELEQDFWIIDHIAHQLVRVSVDELATWCDNVDDVPQDQGFMNILIGPGLAQ